MTGVVSAHAADADAIRLLLQECDLPCEDLTPAHLEHFLVIRDGARLAGVVGLEFPGRAGLLRSLAVAP
jgi:N-acetylglutamate synthase-like GNAT family acetyltransferase